MSAFDRWLLRAALAVVLLAALAAGAWHAQSWIETNLFVKSRLVAHAQALEKKLAACEARPADAKK